MHKRVDRVEAVCAAPSSSAGRKVPETPVSELSENVSVSEALKMS